jgi:hypothetical protein
VQHHFSARAAGDVRRIARDREAAAEDVAHGVADERLVQQLREDRAFVDQVPDALIGAVVFERCDTGDTFPAACSTTRSLTACNSRSVSASSTMARP